MLQIIFSPSQKLFSPIPVESDLYSRFRQQFNENFLAGLVSLLKKSELHSLHPSLVFWSSFCQEALRSLCIDHGKAHPLNQLTADQLFEKSQILPQPHHINQESLINIWGKLQDWLCNEFKHHPQAFTGWIKEHFPEWQKVGMLHFHLAEQTNQEQKGFIFLATMATQIGANQRLQHAPIGKLATYFSSHKLKENLIQLLKPLQSLSDKHPFLKELIKSKKVFEVCPLNPKEAFQLLQCEQILHNQGVVLKLPKNWQSRPSKLKVDVTVSPSDEQKLLGFRSLFQLQVKVRLGDQELTQEQLNTFFKEDDHLIEINGRWFEAQGKKVQHLLSRWQQAAAIAQQEGLSFADALRIAARSPLSKIPNHDFDEQLVVINLDKNITNAPSKEAYQDLQSHRLQASLRSYQLEGYRWLNHLFTEGMGGCLADDMGLGKTIQIIAAMSAQQKFGPHLVCAPASLLGNWAKEIQRFTPHMRVVIAHPQFMSPKEIPFLEKHPHSFDILITSHHYAARIGWLKEHRWGYAVVDEAQILKNPNSQISQDLKTIPGRSHIALSGTPIENNLTDLWSIFDFCTPKLLGHLHQFQKHYGSKQIPAKSKLQIQKIIAPFFLRRKKTDKKLIPDLPAKTERKVFCDLSLAQYKLYRQTIEEMKKELKSDLPEFKKSGLVLKYLMQFKQICNHPSQFYNDGRYDLGDSGKFTKIVELAQHIAKAQEKVLIFTQFKELTDILNHLLIGVFHQKGYIIHGSTPVAKRQSMVNAFNKPDGGPFFILSLKAGGTGLNLTAANHVIHFDRWWNPAIENQATDRAYRIGQQKNVLVHKLICKGTIEDKIDQLVQSKNQLADEILEFSEAPKIAQLPADEVIKLFAADFKCQSEADILGEE